jgi:hypothetical protein
MNNPLIEINEGPLSGDVFYGSIRINGERVGVSNLTELGKTCEVPVIQNKNQ